MMFLRYTTYGTPQLPTAEPRGVAEGCGEPRPGIVACHISADQKNDEYSVWLCPERIDLRYLPRDSNIP